MRYLWILGTWSCIDLCSERQSSSVDGIPIDSSLVDTANGGALPNTKAEHVVVLVMDGARIEETFGTDLANVSDASETSIATEDLFTGFKSSLLPQGTLIRPGYNTGVTITGPGHCSLLTGIRQNFGQFSTPADPGWYRPELPTVYEAVKKAFPDASLKVGGNTDHPHSLDHSVYPGVASDDGAVYDFVASDDDPEKPNDADESVITWAEDQLSGDNPPMVLLGNMHSIDRAGHYGGDDYAYGKRVEQIGDPLVAFWSWVQSEASGVKDKTLLIVVSDHGRHRWGAEEADRLEGDERYDQDYRTHGDQCRGCREVPMFLIGPGIKAGVESSAPYSLEDVARTIAYALGVDLPTAEGIVIADAFVTLPPTGSDRTGDVSPAIAGDVAAAQRYAGAPSLRSQVVLDDEVMSAATAALAEEPRLWAGDAGTFACWRELTLDIDSDAIDWPWMPRCLRKAGTGWTDIGFPVDEVWPLFATSIAAEGDHVLVAFADNSNATTYSETRGGVRLARWDETGGWTLAADFNGELYPSNPVVAMRGDTPFVAYAASDVTGGDSTDAGRYTRHVEVQQIDWTGPEPVFAEVFRTYADDCPAEAKCPTWDPSIDAEGFTYGRMESPALTSFDDGLALAFVAYGDEAGNTILVSTSNASGGGWTTAQRADTTGRVFGHVAPLWVDDAVVWARLSAAETVEVCRSRGLGDPECVDTGAPRIMGLATDGASLVASLDQGVADWVVSPIEWP